MFFQKRPVSADLRADLKTFQIACYVFLIVSIPVFAKLKPWLATWVAIDKLDSYWIIFLIAVPVSVCLRLTQKVKKLGEGLNWVGEIVRSHEAILKANGLSDNRSKQSVDSDVTASPESTRWPWGEHHTELLGHLDAAARQWWSTYEPANPGTAPTNDMVSDWLQSERGVSKDKAKAIASILRADGLRTGPRH